jgi:hypothetical protein
VSATAETEQLFASFDNNANGTGNVNPFGALVHCNLCFY